MGDPKYWTRDEAPKTFFNPLSKDLVLNERDDDNKSVIYTIARLDYSTHPTYLAEMMINHLVDAVINDRNLGFQTPEERAKIREEIEHGY